MDNGVRSSRRKFIKFTVISGVGVWLAPLHGDALSALFEENILTPVKPAGAAGPARFRIDGTAKVTGKKVFAYDIRARNMPHWPQRQAHAFFVRATRTDRVFTGIDLALLDPDLKPDRVVTAEDLARDGLRFPDFYGDDMLLPAGKQAAYLGHAVAILIYHDFNRFRFAKNKVQFQDKVVVYGDPVAPQQRDPWGAFRYVRVGGSTPYDDDAFSSLKNSPLFPSEKKVPRKTDVTLKDQGPDGIAYGERIAQELAAPPDDWLILKRDYFSQSTDTSALEPDNANGWYDAATQSLHLVLATQSPQEVMTAAVDMVKKSRFPLKQLFIHPCYTVGYGSKDHCNVPYYGLVAALYGDGNPVRFANDRFEHFQTALKRHSFKMHYEIAVDRKTGLFQTLKTDFEANGGGRANFSPSVAMVAATAAQSIYYFPKNDCTTTDVYSRAVDAGSARGYGTLQSMNATEMAVDEIAQMLGIDAIELRLKNVLKSGMKNTQGAVPAGAVRADEVLERARLHPLWTERAKRKQAYELAHPGQRYGVGFACVQKDFGTGAEAIFARVELSPEGRIALHHIGVDIGTGMATSQAVVCARWLGRPADSVRTAVTEWDELPLTTSGDTYLIKQAEQDKFARDPMWTPAAVSPSSASNSANFFSHGTSGTARVVFEHGIWPAALAIWSGGYAGGQAASYVVRREDARWENGKLTASGMEPLSLEQLAKKAHELQLVTAAVGHAFNRWQWAEADFDVHGETVRRPLDGLAVRYGGTDKFTVIGRRNVFFPAAQRNNAGVTYYSAIGTLVELAVGRSDGAIELLSHHSIMECGNQIVPQLVSGQLQGGLAMGIGHALHEYLPLYEDGPGNGTWNFNRYHLPRASDVAVWKQSGEVLPPLSATDPSKGIAEVVMIPVVAAIANGIAHAVGHRFTELPITAEKIQGVLS
jgi:CO/xanthine dehydrogenase Mo-binding subunit